MKFFRLKRFIPELFVILVVAYLLFLIRPAILGQLGGTFQPHSVPNEYVKLEKFLDAQHQFSRTLWVPTTQRFGFYSSIHPAISAEDLFHVSSVSGVVDALQDKTLRLTSFAQGKSLEKSSKTLLQEAGVKYVIVPYDSEGEIFLKDRVYSSKLYEQTVKQVESIQWLHEISGFGKIHVFEVPHPKDHFWIASVDGLRVTGYELRIADCGLQMTNGELRGNQTRDAQCAIVQSIQMINPTMYKISVENVLKGERLVFSESYDKFWLAKTHESNMSSQLYEEKFNSFVLPKSGSYTITVFYQPQQWVNWGLWISGATAFILCLYGILYGIRKFVK